MSFVTGWIVSISHRDDYVESNLIMYKYVLNLYEGSRNRLLSQMFEVTLKLQGRMVHPRSCCFYQAQELEE